MKNRPTNRIKEVLIERGIKQTWLAEKLGKSFTIVNSYVCNRRQPSLELLFQIAEILEIEAKQLVEIRTIIQINSDVNNNNKKYRPTRGCRDFSQ